MICILRDIRLGNGGVIQEMVKRLALVETLAVSLPSFCRAKSCELQRPLFLTRNRVRPFTELPLDSNPDYWTWKADTSKKFTVQNARRIVDNHALPSGLSPTRWCRHVPSKVNIFSWRLLLNRLPTKINIMEREIDIPSILCSIYTLQQEDVDHLFLHFEVASRIWHKIGI
ncbi:RNA-directed DNA polymerase, eukaryota [Tanacetum coccineum]